MAYSIMKTYIFLALFVAFSPIFCFSLLTGSDSKNTTYPEETVREVKNFDVLRQLLNQETIIRMSMAKDMLNLKQSLVGEVSALKQTTAELKRDLQKLKRENEPLSNENVKYSEDSDQINKTLHILHSEFKQSKQKLSSAVSSLEMLQTNISMKQSFLEEISTFKQTAAELKMDLRLLKRENERLSNENVKCSENVNLVLGNSDKINKTLHILHNEFEQSKQSFLGEISTLKQTSAELKMELQLLKRENERLGNENVKYSEKSDKMNKSLHILHNELKQSKQKLSSAVSSLEILQKNISMKQSFQGEISTLKQTTAELKKDLRKLKQENEHLGNESIKCSENVNLALRNSGDISTLNQTTAELKKDSQKLKRENEHLSNENIKCSDNINLIFGNSDVMNKAIDKLNNELKQSKQTLSSAVSSLDVKVSKNIRDTTRNVAFTVGVSSTDSSWTSGTLVFPRVVYNIGGGYDPNTGVFTAPVNGHFVFFVNVQSYSSQYIYTYLVLNGAPKFTTMAFNSNFSSGPNLAVLRLQKGDRVWVKHYKGKGYYTAGAAPMTTFSGFLI